MLEQFAALMLIAAAGAALPLAVIIDTARGETRGKRGGPIMRPLIWILAPFVFLYSMIKAIFDTMK